MRGLPPKSSPIAANPNFQQEWPAFDGFRLDASARPKLASDLTGWLRECDEEDGPYSHQLIHYSLEELLHKTSYLVTGHTK